MLAHLPKDLRQSQVGIAPPVTDMRGFPPRTHTPRSKAGTPPVAIFAKLLELRKHDYFSKNFVSSARGKQAVNSKNSKSAKRQEDQALTIQDRCRDRHPDRGRLCARVSRAGGGEPIRRAPVRRACGRELRGVALVRRQDNPRAGCPRLATRDNLERGTFSRRQARHLDAPRHCHARILQVFRISRDPLAPEAAVLL